MGRSLLPPKELLLAKEIAHQIGLMLDERDARKQTQTPGAQSGDTEGDHE